MEPHKSKREAHLSFYKKSQIVKNTLLWDNLACCFWIGAQLEFFDRLAYFTQGRFLSPLLLCFSWTSHFTLCLHCKTFQAPNFQLSWLLWKEWSLQPLHAKIRLRHSVYAWEWCLKPGIYLPLRTYLHGITFNSLLPDPLISASPLSNCSFLLPDWFMTCINLVNLCGYLCKKMK